MLHKVLHMIRAIWIVPDMEGPRRHYWKKEYHPFPFASLGLDTNYPRELDLSLLPDPV